MEEKVILVDEKDNPIGTMEKLQAHKKGLLHRAFSGFVFNDSGKLLLQQRAFSKYHNPGIWSNTVCSHQHENETTPQAVKRRLKEELGFQTDFTEIDTFIYKVNFKNGLCEHELDHICIGKYNNEEILINQNEVNATRWISRTELESEIKSTPENFSYWMKEILNTGIINKYFK